MSDFAGFCEYCKHGKTRWHKAIRWCTACGHQWAVFKNGKLIRRGVRGKWTFRHEETVT